MLRCLKSRPRALTAPFRNQARRGCYTSSSETVVASPWAFVRRFLVFPVTLNEPGILQPVDHPVHRRPRASRRLLQFPAMHVPSFCMRLEQDVKHVEGRLGDPCDASHGAYIT